MATMACRLHLLEKGEETRRHRHTPSTIYHVVEGRGQTQVGEITLTWEPGDTFVVPNWTWHQHAASSAEQAILFSVSDEPILAPFGLVYHEEASGGDAVRAA